MKPDTTETVYSGSLVSLVVERWGGRTREIVESPNAVAIVAVDHEGYVTLVRQLREAARTNLLELPAGGIESGESPVDAAKRELREETGLTGGSWRPLGSFYTTPGFARERMDVFLAEGLDPGPAAPTADEAFDPLRVPAGQLDSLIPEIEDAKTLAGLLLYLRQKGHQGAEGDVSRKAF